MKNGVKVDLTNKRFGKLLVLKEDINRNKSGSVCWICKCDCGTILSVSGDNLRRCHTQSCGCKKKDSAQNRVVDLTGKKFGLLTVIGRDNNSKSRRIYWLCNCDCGKKNISIYGENIKRGRTKSCGCDNYKRPKNLEGQKVGKLLVLSQIYKNNKVYWRCKCDCGNIVEVFSSHLIGKRTQSCGCINYSIGEKNIEKILKQNEIEYIKEFIFPNFGKYRYDFYLPKYNRLIEFDGRQHYENSGGSWYNKNDEFNKRQERDKIKNNYALNHGIDLIRIPYWERDNITIEFLLGNKFLIKGE